MEDPHKQQHFVSYVRVSTRKQGQSGLGLDAQRDAVRRHIESRGALISEFQEVESGQKSDRPALAQALDMCRRKNATLIVAKLDRLARNVAFISALMEAGVEFVAADMPNANRLTLHIFAAVAEHEREMISERTKAGLAQAKLRGIKLGSPVLLETSQKGANAVRSHADEFAARVQPVIEEIRRTGVISYRDIAACLNARGVKTARGGCWHQGTVRRIEKRARGLHVL